MSNRPSSWMPLYWGDYAADTGHLSTEQHGAYLLLIGHYWVTGRPLPDDDDVLARIARATVGRWRLLRSVVLAFFTLGADGWRHKRIDAELQRASDGYMRRANAAQKRWSKHMQCTSNASAMDEQPQPQPHSEANASETVASATRPARGARLAQDWAVPDDWLHWACWHPQGPGLDEKTAQEQALVFRDYWIAQPGQKGVKTDWFATWRNWTRRAAKERANGKRPNHKLSNHDAMLAGIALASDLLDRSAPDREVQHPDDQSPGEPFPAAG